MRWDVSLCLVSCNISDLLYYFSWKDSLFQHLCYWHKFVCMYVCMSILVPNCSFMYPSSLSYCICLGPDGLSSYELYHSYFVIKLPASLIS